MKFQYLDFDHNLYSVECKHVIEIIPFEAVMVSPVLQEPYTALLSYHGKILPVKGILPEARPVAAEYDERPWIMVLEEHAQIIYGLPQWEAAETVLTENLQQSVA
jgi:hypothetical protein